MSATYKLELTGHQLRVLHENLSMVLNDPDWPALEGRDRRVLGNAAEKITDAWRAACRAESTPAT